MIDHVVVDRKLMNHVLDVTVQRGGGGGMSDHCLLLTMLQVSGKKKYVRKRK